MPILRVFKPFPKPFQPRLALVELFALGCEAYPAKRRLATRCEGFKLLALLHPVLAACRAERACHVFRLGAKAGEARIGSIPSHMVFTIAGVARIARRRIERRRIELVHRVIGAIGAEEKSCALSAATAVDAVDDASAADAPPAVPRTSRERGAGRRGRVLGVRQASRTIKLREGFKGIRNLVGLKDYVAEIAILVPTLVGLPL